MKKIVAWWKRKNLRNPIDIVWRMVWYVPAAVCLVLTALFLTILTLDTEAGLDFWSRGFDQ